MNILEIVRNKASGNVLVLCVRNAFNKSVKHKMDHTRQKTTKSEEKKNR